MSLIEYLDKLVTERGSAAILDKHLAFVREQAQALEKQVDELQRANTTLNQRVADLEAQMASNIVPDQFVEHRGALFKRHPQGGYHEAVYCPSCRGPMMSMQTLLPYQCRCGVSVDFTGNDLKSVMRGLPH